MINPPDNPARLDLPADRRVLMFSVALSLVTALLAGLTPALHASAVEAISVLKGGEDPRSRRRLMHGLIALQVAFCFLVLFLTGMFVVTAQRLSHKLTGFSAERIVVDASGVLQPRSRGTFVVRTFTADPAALAPLLRQELPRARPEFHVNNIRTQKEINETVALLLAAVGLYGVLHYSVLQRRREIAIRMAIGAQAQGIVRLVTLPIISMILLGGFAGLLLGLLSVRYIQELFYHVRPTDFPILALPSVMLLAAASVAAIPVVLRAIHTDPASVLRSE
jgi:predicted lysophospholipase L1 biosynthesis ABC-type transport system permease subunit